MLPYPLRAKMCSGLFSRTGSEDSQEFVDGTNDLGRTDPADDVSKLSLPLESINNNSTTLYSPRDSSLSQTMVAEGRQSPTPPASGTDPETPKSSDSPKSAASAAVNDDEKSSSHDRTLLSRPSSRCCIKPSGPNDTVESSSTDKVKPEERVSEMSTGRLDTTSTKTAESAISSLVDKYSLHRSSITSEELTSSSGGWSSSVAQLESFVASVAVIGRKVPATPTAADQAAAKSLPAIQNAVAVPSSQQPTGVNAAISSAKQSKPSRSKSSTSAGGIGQTLKSGSEKARLKSSSAAVATASASTTAAGVVPIQGSTSALSLYPSQIAAGLMGSFLPVPVQMCSSATAVNEQPLDLSSKSSRQSESKYLNPDTGTSAGQGLSSLISLERQFGKGSAIFDRIGTKAWAAPYCAAAIRLGLPTFPSTATSAATPNMPFADPANTPGSQTLGSHSGTTPKSVGNGRSSDRIAATGSSSKEVDTPRSTHARRPPMQSPSDATSLLPWVQLDQKKPSISTSSAVATTAGTSFPHSSSNSSSSHHNHTNFRCSCGASMESLYELTLHIQKTGHSPAPPPTLLAVPPSDGESTGTGSVTGSASSAGGSGNSGGTGSSSTSSSSSKPYEYSKLVRGQDVWLSGGGERTRRSILRCIECGESFRSLPELTVHMVHTRHYTNIVGSSAGGSGIGSSDMPGSSGSAGGGASSSHQQRKLTSSASSDKPPSKPAGNHWVDRTKHSPSGNSSKQLHSRRQQVPEVQTARSGKFISCS